MPLPNQIETRIHLSYEVVHLSTAELNMRENPFAYTARFWRRSLCQEYASKCWKSIAYAGTCNNEATEGTIPCVPIEHGHGSRNLVILFTRMMVDNSFDVKLRALSSSSSSCRSYPAPPHH